MQATVEARATGVSAMIDDEDEVTRRRRIRPTRPADRTSPTDQARVGSITKTAMAVIALQLAGEGTLTLGDTIESWLPGWFRTVARSPSACCSTTPAASSTTPTTPTSSPASSPTRTGTGVHARSSLSRSHPPLFPPGQAGRTTTGLHPARPRAAEGYRRVDLDLVRQRVVRPLDLDNTYFANSARFRGSYAHGCAPPSVTGDGYQDLSRWSPAGRGPPGPWCPTRQISPVLPGTTVRTPALTCAAPHHDDHREPRPGFAYGLGIFALDTPCGRVWGHDGGIPSTSASP